MYHEEKIINDVLCWRGTPNGEWHKYSDNVLTDRVIALRAQLAEARAVITAYAEKIPEPSYKLAAAYLAKYKDAA